MAERVPGLCACDPAEPDSIRRAVRAALADEPSLSLLERIQKLYTWAHTAEQTLSAYESVLERRAHTRPGRLADGDRH